MEPTAHICCQASETTGETALVLDTVSDSDRAFPLTPNGDPFHYVDRSRSPGTGLLDRFQAAAGGRAVGESSTAVSLVHRVLPE